MRDILIFLCVFLPLPFVFKRPAVGVLLFTWLSLMNPHRLAYGFAYDFPFAAVVAAVTAVGVLLHLGPKQFPNRAITITLCLFTAWMALTSVFALEPDLVWREFDRVMKTLFMIIISIMALNTEKDLKRYVIVVALSLGIFGLKGGLFTVMSGGNYRVYGPQGSYIEENNAMALAMVTILPLVWYLRSLVTDDALKGTRFARFGRLIRAAILAMVVFTAFAAMGSYSRGALVGGAAMLFFLWLHSSKKLQAAILVIILGGLIAAVMPAQWTDRMNTINEYQQDGSAMGRINAWQFAINLASNNLLGGGFNVFSKRMFQIYAPNPDDYHVAHSIYFQVLGDHGFIGLLLFVLLLIFAWRSGSRIVKLCKDKSELKWAGDLASMCKVSIIGYAVSGAFLSLAYYDLYYDIIVILVVLEKIVISYIPARLSIPSSHAINLQKRSTR